MKILHVVEAFGGGMLEIVCDISARHAEEGHEVGIAYGIRPETPESFDAIVHPAVRLHPTPWTDRSLGAQLRAGRALRALVRETQPDVVHLHSSFAGAVGGTVLRGVVPLVYTPQGYSFCRGDAPLTRRAYKLVERFVAHRVDLVGACSDSEAEMAAQLVDRSRIRIVANGIPDLDAGAVVPAARERERPLVLALGRIVPQRDPAGVARILAGITDVADVKWIGGGPLDGPLRDAGIEVTGWLPHEETMRYLSEATAYLHWTAWDGLPLSVLEAMARDVIVVGRDIGPNRELLGHDQVCAEEADATALLRHALTEPDVARALRDAQRARRGYFSADRMAAGWLDLYRDLAAQPVPDAVLAPAAAAAEGADVMTV